MSYSPPAHQQALRLATTAHRAKQAIAAVLVILNYAAVALCAVILVAQLMGASL